jgi:Arc/MetJ family transcription regulator
MHSTNGYRLAVDKALRARVGQSNDDMDGLLEGVHVGSDDNMNVDAIQ